MNCVQPQGGRLDRASGRRTRIHSRLQRRLGERGATLVEYALGISLVCVASLGGLQFLEDGASDEYEDRADRAGAPDLEAGSTDGGSTDSTDGSTDSTDGPVITNDVFFGGFSDAGGKLKKPGNPWTAQIEVNVVDDAIDGDGVDGTQVDGLWTYVEASVTKTVAATCNQTNPQGVCKFQLSDIPFSVGEVVFTLLDISGGVPEVTYVGGPVPAPAIVRPN